MRYKVLLGMVLAASAAFGAPTQFECTCKGGCTCTPESHCGCFGNNKQANKDDGSSCGGGRCDARINVKK